MASFLPTDSTTKVNKTEQNSALFKQIVLNENEHIIKIVTLNGHKIYLKYKRGTKTFIDIKNFIFDHIKYSCDGLCDKDKYTFEFNQTPLSDIITKNLTPIENSEEGSKLLDTLAMSDIKLKLIFNREKLDANIYNKYYGNIPSQKEITESNKKFSEQYDVEIGTGKTLIFRCDPENTTVNDLKVVIYCKEGIPLDQSRLIYSGKQLEDNYLISDYISDFKNVTMHLVLRLRGGMFNEVSGRDGAYKPLTDLYYDMDEVDEINKMKEFFKSEQTIQSISDVTCKPLFSSDAIVLNQINDKINQHKVELVKLVEDNQMSTKKQKNKKNSGLVKKYSDLISNDQSSSLSDDLDEIIDELDENINSILSQTSNMKKIIKKNKSKEI